LLTGNATFLQAPKACTELFIFFETCTFPHVSYWNETRAYIEEGASIRAFIFCCSNAIVSHSTDLTVAGARSRLEQYVSNNEKRVYRALGRPAPQSRPKTADDKVMMQTVIGQVPAQAAEAWIKLSNEQGKEMAFSFLTMLTFNLQTHK